MAVITGHEEEQIGKANASGLAPVVFVHGLWLLPSSWGPVGRRLRRSGLCAAHPVVAR
jgi:pimeloyl-ACP methyl ester carboxylesterase